MGWESRSGTGRRYYTRSRRVGGGKVVREYLGSGVVAEAAAILEAVRREEEAAEKERQRAERERLDALEAEVSGFCEQVDEVLRATLEAAGYHRHARGAWRKQRKRRTEGEKGDDRRGDNGCGDIGGAEDAPFTGSQP